MSPLTRILSLAVFGSLIGLAMATGAARAGDSTQTVAPAVPSQSSSTPAQAGVKARQLDGCQAQRRAISRRVCQARLSYERHVETADNK